MTSNRYPDYGIHAAELAAHAHEHAGSRGLRALADANDVDGAVTATELVVVDTMAIHGWNGAMAHMVMHDLVLALLHTVVLEYTDINGLRCRDFAGDLLTGHVRVRTAADDDESRSLAQALSHTPTAQAA